MISLCLRHSAANFHDNISQCQILWQFWQYFANISNEELSSYHKNDILLRNFCEKQAQFPQNSLTRKLNLFCSDELPKH